MFVVKRYGQARSLSCSNNTSRYTESLRYVSILGPSPQDLIDFIVFSDNNNSNQLQLETWVATPKVIYLFTQTALNPKLPAADTSHELALK